MKIYHGDWSDYASMCQTFEESHWNGDTKAYDKATLPSAFPLEAEVLLAVDDEDSYEGSAVVIFKRDGQLFEWEGSHCSCNGLNDSPEEWARLRPITKEYLTTAPSRLVFDADWAELLASLS